MFCMHVSFSMAFCMFFDVGVWIVLYTLTGLSIVGVS